MLAFLRMTDLRSVWYLQSRRLRAELEFWLILAGYNQKTHSFGSRLYLFYVIIFFSVWIFAVLTLLAGIGGQALRAMPFGSPFVAATVIALVGLFASFLFELYSATRKSPFIFSDADATLLCMTPVNRSAVGLIWFFRGWIVRSLFLWPAMIVLGYAVLEAQYPGQLGASDLPRYILAGMRMLIALLPLQLAAQALAWATGSWRLSWKHRRASLWGITPLLAALAIIAWVLSSSSSAAGIPDWAWTISFPIRSGVGVAPLLPGFVLGLILGALGLVILWKTTEEMSLTWAAQESRGQEAQQTANLLGAGDLAQEMKLRERLGVERKPGRLPIRPGLWVLAWKNTLQGIRSLSIGQIFPWTAILGVSLSVILIPDWGARGWSLLFLILLVGGLSTSRLRKDLGHWWIFHQLPFSAEQWVILDLGWPLIWISLMSIASLVLVSLMGGLISALIGWLLLPGMVGVALIAVIDVLRQCRTGRLLAGNVPDRSFLSVLLSALFLAIPAGLAWLATAGFALPLWFAITISLITVIVLDYMLFRWASYSLRYIRT